jgi:dTDP-4-amino-4,6-dideoxygalactose transaminase
LELEERSDDMRVPLVDLQAQYAALRAEVQAAMARVMERADFILGEEVSRFETEFATYCGVEHAVGVDSGLSALELILRSLDIGPGDEVITAANSFIASASAISHTGARPVLVDVDPATYNIDVAGIERAITPRTRAVMPVHLYGRPAAMEPILALARRRGLWVVEDACQAHGARYRGARVGSLGDAAAFSFYPGKNLGAYGDGGIVVTRHDEIDERVRTLRNYGQREKYRHETVAYNRRLDSLQAAVLRVKLRRLDDWNAARRDHAAAYRRGLAGLPLAFPGAGPGEEPVYHLYVVRTKDRGGLAAQLDARGVATGIHYPLPIHLQPAYAGLGYPCGSFPVTERYAEEILSLPIYPELPAEASAWVCEGVRAFFEGGPPLGAPAFRRSGVEGEKDLLSPECLNARTPERVNAGAQPR